MAEVFPKRRPLLPVIHHSKALGHASKEDGMQVRCFYALSHRGANPIDSEFHMQARLGFRRRNNNKVRLRPIEKLVPLKQDSVTVEKSSKSRHTIADRNARKKSVSKSAVDVQSKRSSEKSPPRNSDNPAEAGRVSPMSVFEEPLEQAGITWTTFQKVTDETVGTIIEGALEEQDEMVSAITKKPFSRGQSDEPTPRERQRPEEAIKEEKSRSHQKDQAQLAEVQPQRVHKEATAELAWKNQVKSSIADQLLTGDTKSAAVKIQSLQRGRAARKSIKQDADKADAVVAEEIPAAKMRHAGKMNKSSRQSRQSFEEIDIGEAENTNAQEKPVTSTLATQADASARDAVSLVKDGAAAISQQESTEIYVAALARSAIARASERAIDSALSIMHEKRSAVSIPPWVTKPSVGTWLRRIGPRHR
jgi:hypothetical protein